MYTLDTNAVIYFIKDEERAAPVISDILAEPSTSSYISTATEAELFAYPDLDDAEIVKIEEFFELVTIIPIDSRVARLAGSLKALHGMDLGDSLVVATTLLMRSTLLTRNTKHFKKIPHLSLQEI